MNREDWQAALDLDERDGTCRLAFADWLEEQGLDVEAEVQRWLARESRHPHRCEFRGRVTYDWWLLSAETQHREDVGHATVPYALFARFAGPVRRTGCRDGERCREFGSRSEAEVALVAAWRRLKRTGLLMP